LKFLIRQARDLKHQVQYFLNSWGMDVQQQEQQQQIKYEQEQQLINLLNKNMWINGECSNKYNTRGFPVQQPHKSQQQQQQQTTVVESSTTTSAMINGQVKNGNNNNNKTTIVKSSVSMPVGNSGLMKPITTIEKIIREEEQQQQSINGDEERISFPQYQQQLNKLRFGGPFELVEEFDDEEDFDFGTDAEITISTLLNHHQQLQQLQPGMIRIENIINGGEKYFAGEKYFGGEQRGEIESCVCQIEKHIRRSLNNNNGGERYTVESIVCPLCTVETTTTTSTSSTGMVRKF
jgi:hypothetical protein